MAAAAGHEHSHSHMSFVTIMRRLESEVLCVHYGRICGAGGCGDAGPLSISKQYMPMVKSILSLGPLATLLLRETKTLSPINIVLAMTSIVAQSAVAVWPSFTMTRTRSFASTRVSLVRVEGCEGDRAELE